MTLQKALGLHLLGLRPHDDGRGWWLAKKMRETKGKNMFDNTGLKRFNHGTMGASVKKSGQSLTTGIIVKLGGFQR